MQNIDVMKYNIKAEFINQNMKTRNKNISYWSNQAVFGMFVKDIWKKTIEFLTKVCSRGGSCACKHFPLLSLTYCKHATLGCFNLSSLIPVRMQKNKHGQELFVFQRISSERFKTFWKMISRLWPQELLAQRFIAFGLWRDLGARLDESPTKPAGSVCAQCHGADAWNRGFSDL